MMGLLAMLVAAQVGTVDRIEGPMAVIDWGDGPTTDLPVALLGGVVQEGDGIRIRLRLSVGGSALAIGGANPQLSTPYGLVTLQHRHNLKPGRFYALAVQTQPVLSDKRKYSWSLLNE